VLYSLLFQSAWKTLKCFGADKKRLNGELGMTAVLHTWGQNLSQHVHLHCLVPGGALSEEGWHAAKGHYLFPVRALSRYFRGAMVSAIRKADQQNKLHRINDPRQVDEGLNGLMKKAWVVYTKPYLKQPETIVTYLARYSHKITISDSRLQSINDEQVTFRWKDYRDKDKHKVMSLSGEEFIRRFLLHVLPKGLMRIRHYGFLANRCRKTKLARIRDVMTQQQAAEIAPGTGHDKEIDCFKPADGRCPKCKQGRLVVIAEMPTKRIVGGERRQPLH